MVRHPSGEAGSVRRYHLYRARSIGYSKEGQPGRTIRDVSPGLASASSHSLATILPEQGQALGLFV